MWLLFKVFFSPITYLANRKMINIRLVWLNNRNKAIIQLLILLMKLYNVNGPAIINPFLFLATGSIFYLYSASKVWHIDYVQWVRWLEVYWVTSRCHWFPTEVFKRGHSATMDFIITACLMLVHNRSFYLQHKSNKSNGGVDKGKKINCFAIAISKMLLLSETYQYPGKIIKAVPITYQKTVSHDFIVGVIMEYFFFATACFLEWFLAI